MFGLIAEIVGIAVGIVAGIAVAPIAIALGVTEIAVKSAIDAGCKTQEEIKEFLDL